MLDVRLCRRTPVAVTPQCPDRVSDQCVSGVLKSGPPFCNAPNVRSEAPPDVARFVRGPRRGRFGAWADLSAGLLPAPVSRRDVRHPHLGGVPRIRAYAVFSKCQLSRTPVAKRGLSMLLLIYLPYKNRKKKNLRTLRFVRLAPPRRFGAFFFFF